jgi:hypothetical protein
VADAAYFPESITGGGKGVPVNIIGPDALYKFIQRYRLVSEQLGQQENYKQCAEGNGAEILPERRFNFSSFFFVQFIYINGELFGIGNVFAIGAHNGPAFTVREKRDPQEMIITVKNIHLHITGCLAIGAACVS